MRNRLGSSTGQTGSIDELQISEYQNQSSDDSLLEQQIRLFGPESYEARYDYPLVVWLHSCFSSELELENVMPELSLRNYVSCAPRGTSCCDADGKFFKWSHTAAGTAIAEEIIFEAIALAGRTFSVASDRIFLAGFGSGATMAWRIGLRYPQRFAGVVSICGDFPHQNQPLTNLHAARTLPALWMYGEDSETCGTDRVCESMSIMHSANLKADIRQYPCADDLLTNMLVDMNGWLMERITHQPASSGQVATESFSRN